MKEVKDYCMLNGAYGTIINFLLKKLSNLRTTNEQDFSRNFNRTSPVLLIPLFSFLFITVIHKSPVLQLLLSGVYVYKEQLLRGTGKNSKIWICFQATVCNGLCCHPTTAGSFTNVLGKRSEKNLL